MEKHSSNRSKLINDKKERKNKELNKMKGEETCKKIIYCPFLAKKWELEIPLL